jgi:hypothetical protein
VRICFAHDIPIFSEGPIKFLKREIMFESNVFLALRSATETLSSISKIMLKQSNTVEIDKSGYTLASVVEAMNGDEDLREVNTTGVLTSFFVFSSTVKPPDCIVLLW